METKDSKENKNVDQTTTRCNVCKHNVQSMDHFDDCYNCVGIGTSFTPNDHLKRALMLNGWEQTGNKATRIILGFPGVGKTYIKERFKGSSIKVIDSDSSYFDKKEFPGNYIEYIKSCIGKFDLILVSTHDVVRKAIAESNIMNRAVVSICYPALDLKEEWIQRLANRGNSEKFLSLIRENYDQWIKDIEQCEDFYKIVLKTKDSYLSGFLYQVGL